MKTLIQMNIYKVGTYPQNETITAHVPAIAWNSPALPGCLRCSSLQTPVSHRQTLLSPASRCQMCCSEETSPLDLRPWQMISSCRRYQASMIACPALQLFLAKEGQMGADE